jgi:hypothetical protein
MKRLIFSLLLGIGGIAQAQSFYEYGAQCAREVTPIPAFSCMAGEVIPITVNGLLTTSFTTTCDKPSLLVSNPPNPQGQCLPGSRALVLRDDKAAQISAICRKHVHREVGSPLFDEINIVSHNLKSGKTCWFTAKAKLPYEKSRGIDGRLVPSPAAGEWGSAPRGYAKLEPRSEVLAQDWRVEKTKLPPADKLWMSPHELVRKEPACTQCHDSGPFMYSPYIAQTTQLPGDPFGKYQPRAIGQEFKRWPQPFAISTRGNTCTTCHRMGNLNSCHLASLQATGRAPQRGGNAWSEQFPQSHWMSPGNLHSQAQWNEAFARSLTDILACCKNPQSAGCETQSYEPKRR